MGPCMAPRGIAPSIAAGVASTSVCRASTFRAHPPPRTLSFRPISEKLRFEPANPRKVPPEAAGVTGEVRWDEGAVAEGALAAMHGALAQRS